MLGSVRGAGYNDLVEEASVEMGKERGKGRERGADRINDNDHYSKPQTSNMSLVLCYSAFFSVFRSIPLQGLTLRAQL
jgi:hypothetical protein